MRIEFLHLERAPFPWSGQSALTIGSDADNLLCLPAPAVDAHHARVLCDARGLVLEVIPGAPRVYVNARPVRERALLRLGDTLGVGEFGLRLCADALVASEASTAVIAASLASLRVTAGPWSGQIFSLAGRLDLDAGARVVVPEAAVLHITQPAGRLRMTSAQAVRINGIETCAADLHDGDQLMLGMHRLVVSAACETPPAVPPQRSLRANGNAHDQRRARRQMGWLVLTASALALALALLLLIGF